MLNCRSITSCWNNSCNKSVELNNLVASYQQAVDNLSTSWEQAVRTHPVDKLLEQHCYKSAAGLLQLVCFYTCVDMKTELIVNPGSLHCNPLYKGKSFNTSFILRIFLISISG